MSTRRLTKTQNRTIVAGEPMGHGRVVATLLADVSVVNGEVRRPYNLAQFVTDNNVMYLIHPDTPGIQFG